MNLRKRKLLISRKFKNRRRIIFSVDTEHGTGIRHFAESLIGLTDQLKSQQSRLAEKAKTYLVTSCEKFALPE